MARTTSNSMKAISKIVRSPTANGMNRGSSLNNNLVTPIDDEAKLGDDKSSDKVDEVDDGATITDVGMNKSELAVKGPEMLQ